MQAEDAVERGLDFLRGEAVAIDLLQVPLDPFELPPVRAPTSGLQDLRGGALGIGAC